LRWAPLSVGKTNRRDELGSATTVFPPAWRAVHDGRETRLRLVGRPEKLAADLLIRMGLRLPVRPKTIENVVEKNDP